MTSETGLVGINGVAPGLRDALKRHIDDTRLSRDLAGPWAVQSVWSSGFASVAHVRDHRLVFEEPGDLSSRDSAPTPHEFLLASMGACLVAGVVLHATVADVTIAHLEIDISGTFTNVLHWAGSTLSEHPGYRSLDLSVSIEGNAPDDVLHDIWTRAFESSPVTQTIIRPTRVSVTLHP